MTIHISKFWLGFLIGYAAAMTIVSYLFVLWYVSR